MSIASEYAARVKAGRPAHKTRFGLLTQAAVVNDDGNLLTPNCVWLPDEALKLAEWIQRTFGPTPKTTPCPDCGAVDWQQDEHSYGCRACWKVLGKP